MRMPVLDIWMWPREDVPCLGLTDEHVGLLRGVDCDILAQSLIGLIEYSVVKHAWPWPGAILGWVTDREVLPSVHK
jgi:hypothetical protein